MWSSLLGSRKKPAQAKPPAQPADSPFGPPLTDEEQNANLSQLERQLNQQMKCPAGKNQVYLRSVLTRRGATPPRIALKCTYRRDIGLSKEVFYEHIRDVCCGDPEKCEAYQAFKKRFVQT